MEMLFWNDKSDTKRQKHLQNNAGCLKDICPMIPNT